jgi:hypothetical protein
MEEFSAQRRLVRKLKKLKHRVKSWANEQRKLKHLKIEKIEEDLEAYYQKKAHKMDTTDSDLHIKELDKEQTKILYVKEDMWRQKSKAIWLQKGDQNTKFFHLFASYKRNQKTIWEIQDENGHCQKGHDALASMAVRHFKEFYTEMGQNSISEKVSTV